MRDFAKVTEEDEKLLKAYQGDSRNELFGSRSIIDSAYVEEGFSKDVIRAIQHEDENKVIDLKVFAKTTETVNMDPDRFLCKLSSTVLKQST